MARSQGQKNKANGTRWESDLVKHFREEWGVEADRLRLSGSTDEGDIILRLPDIEGDRKVIVEAKSGVNIRPKEWHREAEKEAANYAAHRKAADIPPSIVVMKKHNFATNQAYVLLSLKDLRGLVLQ